jgi:hypothetical protein
MRPTLMTPAERDIEICRLEREKEVLRSSYAWKQCFDDDERTLDHRRHLTNLIGALDERIGELRVRRGLP